MISILNIEYKLLNNKEKYHMPIKQLTGEDLIQIIQLYTRKDEQGKDLIQEFKQCKIYYKMDGTAIIPDKIGKIKVDLENKEITIYADLRL